MKKKAPQDPESFQLFDKKACSSLESGGRGEYIS